MLVLLLANPPTTLMRDKVVGQIEAVLFEEVGKTGPGPTRGLVLREGEIPRSGQ
jgi:hypothetical protein